MNDFIHLSNLVGFFVLLDVLNESQTTANVDSKVPTNSKATNIDPFYL